MPRWYSVSVALLIAMAAIPGTCPAQPDPQPAEVLPSIAVLEFHDFSNYQGHLLGRRVAASLYDALAEVGRWRLVDPQRVNTAVAEMELGPPFAVGYQQALAHKLGADITVTGRIERVDVEKRNDIRVTLVVDFVERIAGQSVMPMELQGVAIRTEMPMPKDMSVDSAIADACRQIVKSARSANPAQAMVRSIESKELVLDTGRWKRLSADDRVLIYRVRVRSGTTRRYEPVGVALVTSVENEKASATLLAKDRDVYTDDVAVCIGPARIPVGQ